MFRQHALVPEKVNGSEHAKMLLYGLAKKYVRVYEKPQTNFLGNIMCMKEHKYEYKQM